MKNKALLLIVCVFLFSALLLADSSRRVVVSEKPKETAPSEDIEKKMFSILENVKVRVAQIRGLKFKTDVSAGILTKEELRQDIIKMIQEEMTDEEFSAQEKVYKKFGLIYPNMHLKDFTIKMLTENIAGFYDPKRKEMMLIKEPATLGAPEVQEKMLDIVLSHELTHALQDQYFDLNSPPFTGIKDNDDFVLAVHALIEGDATLLMIDYMRPAGEKSVSQIPEFDESIAMLLATGTMTMSPDTPKILVEQTIFPYMRGLKFVMQKKEGNVWENIDKMFADLPTSTEQVLHPEKYFGKRDYPILVKLPDLEGALGNGWKRILENDMGELNVGVLLSEFILGEEAEKSAEGWGGDRFAGYENQTDNKIFICWYTTWDTPEDADEFLESSRKYVQNKYRDDKLIDSETKGFYLWETSQGLVKVLKKNKDVILIEGAPKDKLKAIEEKITSGTQMMEFHYTRPTAGAHPSPVEEK